MYVTGAFPYGQLKESVYMSHPNGLEELGKEKFVCELQNSISRVVQAPGIWYQLFRSFLDDLGFTPLMHSDCIFVISYIQETAHILRYVDDMLILGGSSD